MKLNLKKEGVIINNKKIENNTKPTIVIDNSNVSKVDRERDTQKSELADSKETELVNSTKETTPYTGDKVPEYTIFAILITIIANLAQVTIDKILKKLRFFK